MFDVKMLDNGEVAFLGRLDAAQAEKADDVLGRITTSKVINFTGLEYISSAGLGVLLAHQKRLREAGFALTLVNVNKYIRDIFMYTGFDNIFEIR
jgi:anti-anti-sigma factor